MSRPSFAHLLRMSDDTGVFEHARGAVPRRAHGYCVDDVARALLVISRETHPEPAVAALGERCLAFLAHAQDADGAFRNRLGFDRTWKDTPGTGDWWGRALWGLGTAAVRHPLAWVRADAMECFQVGATRRSPSPRSMAFAALGAAEVAVARPADGATRSLLVAAASTIGRPARDPSWPWPEPRLTYANAVIPDALLATGHALGDDRLVEDGLRLLGWLLDIETGAGHLSVTPVGGWGPGEHRATFDQQPIEASSLADACARAFACTGHPRWLAGVELALGWFRGDNDAGVALLDPSTGGGYDGLTDAGCNTNQGAESTLALIATEQHESLRLRADRVNGPDAASSLVTRSAVHLTPDCARVYDAIFMPGQELPGDHSRATAVINRVITLDDGEVGAALADLRAWFPDRPSLDDTYLRHFDVVAHRLGTNATPSPDRRLLIGAYFTHDVAPEAAALTNPSMVAHPDQSGTAPGELRFILTARAIGEGHVSSIEFRTGVVDAEGQVRIDPAGGHLETPRQEPSVYRRASFVAQLNEGGTADETTHLVLDRLGDTFDRASLEASIARLPARLLGRESSRDAVSSLLAMADNTYTVSFASDTDISERILVPTGPTESNGLEDARLVRFVDDDGSATYLATYTAYDGRQITPQLLRTDDFRTFTAHQLSGPAAKNKGMALFPRRIGGRFACLTRWDRESSFVAWSDDAMTWDSATPIQAPGRWWDLIQVGNCGSPIETSAGWVVLTHGVGPMRTYAIGVMLLDLERPDRVLATLPTPLIAPHGEERIGYVPNVVYSCGGLVHRDRLVVPYGYGDRAITVAVVDLPALLGVLTGATRASAWSHRTRTSPGSTRGTAGWVTIEG